MPIRHALHLVRRARQRFRLTSTSPDRFIALADSGQYQFFCIRGNPRSGTNWVGNLLNLHPAISAQGEFRFTSLTRQYTELGEAPVFNKPSVKATADEAYRRFVKAVILSYTAHQNGVSARWIGDRSPEAIEPPVLPAPHFCIFRDGRDCLVSWTYHVLRIDRVADKHFHNMPRMQKKKEVFDRYPHYFQNNPTELLDDEHWVRTLAGSWAGLAGRNWQSVRRYHSGELDIPVHTVFYEQLHRDTEAERRAMYRFLDLDPEEAASLTDWTAPGFKQENVRSHYRKGEPGQWRRYFTDNTYAWYMEEAGETLAELGYST